MAKLTILLLIGCWLLTTAWLKYPMQNQNPPASGDLDRHVRQFLQSHARTWHDLNVPAVDGQKLHDIVLKNNYRHALEIGTSTGHSGIWIAWALATTGGRLVTVEIDENRYKQAIANFKEAGLANYIDARLGDAHRIVPALTGPIDFVFCDADKDWYPRYLAAVLPKLAAGGCFAAHNISEGSYPAWSRDFLRYAQGLPGFETTLFTGGAGLSLSYKRAVR